MAKIRTLGEAITKVTDLENRQLILERDLKAAKAANIRLRADIENIPGILGDDVLLYLPDESTSGLQAAIISQLSADREGVGGVTRVRKISVTDTGTIVIESADNQSLRAEGQYATQRIWHGGSSIPWFKLDQLRAFEMADLRLTAVTAYPLLEFLRMQDDQTEPSDPSGIYANNRRSTQNLIRRMQLDGAGVTQRGVVIYLANFNGAKNDHHMIDQLTIDSYLESGLVIEGQASTAHMLVKLVVRSGIGGVTRGMFGVRTGILPYDARLGTVDSQGDTWTSLDGKGGTFKMYGGEVLDNDVADFYLDSRNGCNLIDGVTMEGSSRFLIAVPTSPSAGINVVTAHSCKWTSNADLAADREVWCHEAQAPANIVGCQFGLAAAPVELCWYYASPRDFAGLMFTGNQVSSPYRHGHFTGLLPSSADGSLNFDAAGGVTPICYPWDGPATKSLPGRAKPYYARDWTAMRNPVPSQWYPCQDTDAPMVVSAVDAGANTLSIPNHARITGSGPFNAYNSGGGLPGNLVIDTDYYLIRIDADTIKLATSQANALAGTAIDLSSAGTGTHTLRDANRKYVRSAVKDRPRRDLLLRGNNSATDTTNRPILGRRRSYPGMTVTSVTNGTDTFTKVGHGMHTGQGPFYPSSTGSVPAGLTALSPYWIIRIDADNWKLATSRANAFAGTAVNITSDGTGTLVMGQDLHQRCVEFNGGIGQILSWDDGDFHIRPDDFSLALDLFVDITAKPANDRYLAVLGAGNDAGLNLRVMNTGFLKLWCTSLSVTGAVDMTLVGPTWIRVIYNKATSICRFITPFEDSYNIGGAGAGNVYGASPGHTQHVGIGVNSASSRAFTGYLYNAALYVRGEAEALDMDLSRFGF